MFASFQGHRGYDGPVVACPAAIPVFHSIPSGRDHGNADGLSRVPSSPCRQVVEVSECADQPFNSESPVLPRMLI